MNPIRMPCLAVLVAALPVAATAAAAEPSNRFERE